MNSSKIISKIKTLMKLRGINQHELSLGTGFSDVSISRFLNGSRKLTIDFIIKISGYFDVSIDWLLNG